MSTQRGRTEASTAARAGSTTPCPSEDADDVWISEPTQVEVFWSQGMTALGQIARMLWLGLGNGISTVMTSIESAITFPLEGREWRMKSENGGSFLSKVDPQSLQKLTLFLGLNGSSVVSSLPCCTPTKT